MNINEIIENIKNNKLNYFNFYNLDLDIKQYNTIQHYLKFTNDNINIDQKLNILFLDIEIYAEESGINIDELKKTAKYPINAITIYSTFEKIYHVFFLIHDKIKNNFFHDNNFINQVQNNIKNELINDNYFTQDEQFKIYTFDNDLDLIKACWNMIHKIDPAILSGWFSDQFDIPYIYQRLKILLDDDDDYNNETNKILSKFGIVKKRTKTNRHSNYVYFYDICDYPILDLMHLYMPRDEKGLNYGKKQPTYSLDHISDIELNLKKIEYNDEGLSLDALYIKDPIKYLKYNLVDVVLVKLLNEKLQHINLHNLLRRVMFDSLSKSVIGQSSLFESYYSYELEKSNTYMKYNVTGENHISLDKKDIKRIPKPNNSKIIITKEQITETEYKSITGSYPGAYVKDIIGCLKTEEDGFIIDLDAASMYPSQVMQNNIGFETYFGYILDPLCYKFLKLIDKVIGTDKNYPEQLINDLCEIILNYLSDKHDKQNKSQLLYLIIMDALYVLKEHNIILKNIVKPSNFKEYLLLKLYLIPLLEIFINIHPNSAEYNSFCYDYFINNEIKHNEIYVIENLMEPNIKINRIFSNNIQNYLKENNLSFNLAGTLFYTHDHKLSSSYQFLENRMKMRSLYKKERDEQKYGSDLYKFNDLRQNIAKVNMNSLYGIFGLKSSRFSNKMLATTITVNARYILKISQICSEFYINSLNN
jgi:DNA polymerase elongation subunit (family B)